MFFLAKLVIFHLYLNQLLPEPQGSLHEDYDDDPWCEANLAETGQGLTSFLESKDSSVFISCVNIATKSVTKCQKMKENVC